MLAYFRQFLVVLFVLLQNVTPLVHAHTDRDDLQSGLHMHLFESLRLSNGQTAISATRNAPDLTGSIFSVDPAIKQHLTIQDTQTVSFLPVNSQALSISHHEGIVNFSPILPV